MIKIYGIPGMIEVSQLFYFNNRNGKLRINFTGGITDPKFNIPATYTTADEFEQLVIEQSMQFGRTVFRYNSNGEMMPSIPFEQRQVATSTKNKIEKAKSSLDDTRVYPEVESIAQATEVLLELGAKAGELGSAEDVMSSMVKYKIAFPNLKIKVK